MWRAVLMLPLALLFITPISGAHAGRYTCKAAQNLARVGARDVDVVLVDPDDVRKECRFSINGEPAGSPPRGAIINAINILRAGKASAELNVKDVDWLAYLLLAASREESISDEFRNQLTSHREELAKCFQGLEADVFRNFQGWGFSNDKDIFCRAIGGGGEVGFGGEHRVEVSSEVPHLVVGVKRRDDASFLFIPFKIFTGPPLK